METKILLSYIVSGCAFVNFFIFALLMIRSKDVLKESFKEIGKRIWIILFLIFGVALLLRFVVPELKHVMYIDEQWYMEAAKNITENGHYGDYLKSVGWPVIISIFFVFFGVNNWVALYAGLLIGAFSVFPAFFFSYVLTKRKEVALLTSFLYSIFPLHIFWSATAENNVVSVFFMMLSLFLFFLYFDVKKDVLLWSALMSLAFTTQIRIENYFIAPLFLFAFFMFGKKQESLFDIKRIAPWLIFLILSLPNFVHNVLSQIEVWSNVINSTPYYEKNSLYSLGDLLHNTSTYFLELFSYFPLLVVIGFVAGIFFTYRKNKKLFAFLLFWFLLFWLIYFAGPLAYYGGRSRMYLSFSPIIIFLSSFGIFCLVNFIKNKKYYYIVFILLISLIFLSYAVGVFSIDKLVAQKMLVLETKIPELIKKDLSLECLIIANEPSVISATTDFKTMRLDYFLDSSGSDVFKDDSCILFFEDIFCHQGYYFQGGEKCQEIKNNYNIEPYKTYSEGRVRCNFYRLYLK